MSGNAKFRWFLLAPILVALLVVVTSSVVSWAQSTLQYAQEMVRENPNDASTHHYLGIKHIEKINYKMLKYSKLLSENHI